MQNKKERTLMKGSAKQINDDFIVISLSYNQIKEIMDKHENEFLTKKGDDAYIPVGISRRKNEDELYGNTHYMFLNKRDDNKSVKRDRNTKDYNNSMKDDLPF